MNFGVAVSIRFTFFRQIGRMIDWQRIAQLENDLGADELPELITLFLNEVGGAVSAMDKPTEDDLHFLRGSASTLGFRDLARLAGLGEEALRQDGAVVVDCISIRTAFTAESSELLLKYPNCD